MYVPTNTTIHFTTLLTLCILVLHSLSTLILGTHAYLVSHTPKIFGTQKTKKKKIKKETKNNWKTMPEQKAQMQRTILNWINFFIYFDFYAPFSCICFKTNKFNRKICVECYLNKLIAAFFSHATLFSKILFSCRKSEKP